MPQSGWHGTASYSLITDIAELGQAEAAVVSVSPKLAQKPPHRYDIDVLSIMFFSPQTSEKVLLFEALGSLIKSSPNLEPKLKL